MLTASVLVLFLLCEIFTVPIHISVALLQMSFLRINLFVLFSTASCDMNLFETEVDKYAAFRELTSAADSLPGTCGVCVC